jgi:transcriptional regulator with XRE-family HTH domain
MRIKELRKEREWNQDDLAKRTKLSKGYIARLETKRHDPKLSTLMKIAKAFEITVADLLR